MCHSKQVQEAHYSTQNVENAGFLGKEVIGGLTSKKKKKIVEEESEEEESEDEEPTPKKKKRQVQKKGKENKNDDKEDREDEEPQSRRGGFSSYERDILKKALCQDGPPTFINETNVEPAKQKFPQFHELYKELLIRKGGDKSKANNALRRSLVKKASIGKKKK